MSHLIEHPFVAQVLADIRPHFGESTKRITEAVRTTGELPPHVAESDEEGYEGAVGRRVIALLARTERLREAGRYVKGVPSPSALKRLAATQDGWIEYHYSYFLGAFASVGDICLLLVNATFALGIAPRNCSRSAIRTNSWVKRTDVPRAIDRVEEVMSRHRERRNLDLHRGTSADIGAVLGDRTFDSLRLLGLVGRASGDAEAAGLAHRGLRSVSANLAQVMSRETDELEEAIRGLLDQLSPVYQDKAPSSIQRTVDEALRQKHPGGAA